MQKTTLALTLLALLGASPVLAKEYVLTDASQNLEKADWKLTSSELGLKVKTPFTITKTTLHGGKQEGSTLLTVDTGALKITVIPTRGMGIYRVESDGIRLGWDSPVTEIVNPAFINLDSRGGLGWLDGFNEMLVRCGYEWTGHPGTENGRLFSLHGRSGNTPASKVVVEIDDQPPHRITLRGLVSEKTFKFSDLETWASVSVTPGERAFHVNDKLTNLSDYPRDYQIIYHSNFGPPLLEGGARFVAPVKEVSPFNDYAVKGLSDWQTYLPPTRDFDEMVFNLKPYADADGKTIAMLKNKAGDKGVAVIYDTQQLPVLTLWKNTDGQRQGYVTGIEPGTNYAYPRPIEREQGRIPQLQPGASQSFDLEYRILNSAEAVNDTEKAIQAILGEQKTQVTEAPMAKE